MTLTRSDALPDALPDALRDVLPEAATACHLLTVTVQDGGHALTRISATLNNLSVRALSYRASEGGGLAVCEIVVPVADSPRAQAKLLRCVDIVGLTAYPAPGSAAGLS